MKNFALFVSVLAVYFSLTGTANAVFSNPTPAPEPGSLSLLVAGGVVVAAVRYLSKRKDQRDE